MRYTNRYYTGTDRSYYKDPIYNNIDPKYMHRVFLNDREFFYKHLQIFRYCYNTSLITLGKVLDEDFTEQEIERFHKVTSPPNNPYTPNYDSKAESDVMKTKLFRLTERYEKTFNQKQGLYYSIEGFASNLDYPR